ncbi:uncharacterized protein LOC113295545 [Papaver somniferum]|uniref:uncharacterized protein LOC113295545 n=1 Tax=Papaver somniferum TaxID=3469 RepID=UPI000E6F5A42|nr:uncharacterized protein LOC113295545 [Papaver somniferum]
MVACSPSFMRKLNVVGFCTDVIHNSTSSWKLMGNVVFKFFYAGGLNKTRQAITIGVEGVQVSFIHASYLQVTRRALWQQLNMGHSQVPWLSIGDYNCVLRGEEKKGGAEPRASVINEFSDWIDDNGHFEANALGCNFTWSNRQAGSKRILSKLDRASWDQPMVGSPAYIFPYKLKRLKADMKEWNILVFCNIYVRLKEDQLRHEIALRESDEDPTNLAKLNAMKDATVVLTNSRLQLATMLKKKSRNKWLVDGSSNTNFFHTSIRIRRSSNTISELVDDNGVTIIDGDQMATHVVNYYTSKFNGGNSVLDDSLFDMEHPSIS